MWSLTGTTPIDSPFCATGLTLTRRRTPCSTRAHRTGDRAHGEERWATLAATEDARVLFVVFTRRQSKLRVVTARDATAREKRWYRQRGR